MGLPAGPILVAILRLPSCWQDRHDERVPEYLAKVAYAISEEARDIDEAAALVAISKHESGDCIRVQLRYTHSGAYGAFQLENKQHLYPEVSFLGLDYANIHHGAYAARDIWSRTFNCGSTFADRMTSYAGRQCGTDWPSLSARVGTYYFVRSVIEKEMKRYG